VLAKSRRNDRRTRKTVTQDRLKPLRVAKVTAKPNMLLDAPWYKEPFSNFEL
jgi:hypothetical protein